jgi:AcrR family transcriptional regulator
VRRDEILEAALEVMSRKGFERTSIAAIADRAGIARATVYQHFCDKQDILVALSDRIARRLIDAVDAWAPLPVGPDAREHELRGLIDSRAAHILGAFAANADATRLIVSLGRGSGHLLGHDMLQQIDDHIVTLLTREIQAATGFRWARTCDAETAARFILGGLESVAMDAIEREAPQELGTPAMAAEIGALVFFALAHRGVLAQGGDAP